MKKKLIILTGPTAVGKTGLSIRLAKAVNGEIISADSMQVYKGMDIGTAKITPTETEGIKHYLIDCLNPDETLSVALFQKLAKEAMEEIYAKGKIPVIVGGTAFYIQALLYDIDFNEEDEEDNSYRNKLYQIAETEEGKIALHNQLNEIDPEYAKTVHYNNAKRVIRALEYFEHTKEKFSVYNKTQKEKNSQYDFCYFVLNNDREALYANINKRVDIMMDNGLLNEVKSIYDMHYDRSLTAMQAVGYKELFSYFDGESTLEDAVNMIKQNSRHLAKRQLTWFRKERDVIWVNKNEFTNDEDKIFAYIMEQIRNMELKNE